MCGRYAFFETEQLYERFGVGRGKEELRETFNAAPSMRMPVIAGGEEKELRLLKWGVTPPWEKEAGKRGIINARVETAAEKRTFKTMFEEGRCLVPANGWFEWQKTAGKKQPFYFKRKDDGMMAFAGLCDADEFLILTTEAWPKLEEVHPRMPLVLKPDAEADWLNPDMREEKQLAEAMAGLPPREISFYRVGEAVNNPRNQEKSVVRRSK